MEALSLLKFWRVSPADTPSPSDAVESDSESSASSEDSFFDLEFTLPGQASSNKNDVDSTSDFLDSPNHLFSKSEPNSKPQSPISFLRSPPKFKVLMFLKKPKVDKEATSATTTPDASPSTPSRFAVKCHVDEFPIWSVLNRVNSSRTKLERKTSEGDLSKRVGKGGVQRYLKMIKPLYAGDGKEVNCSAADPASSPTLTRSPSKQVERKQESRTASLRAIYKLGKSRSSAGAGVAPVVRGSKSDDSAVLHNDGIQGAILHCKRSYNSPRGCSSQSRFASEASSDEISGGSSSRNSSEDEKERISI